MYNKRLPGNGMQQKRVQSFLKWAYNMHKYIRVIYIYINKGGSILFNIINIPVFFFFSSYSSQRNTHSPLSKDKGIQKIKLTLQTLMTRIKSTLVLSSLCANYRRLQDPLSIRHIQKAKPGARPHPDMEKGDNRNNFPKCWPNSSFAPRRSRA